LADSVRVGYEIGPLTKGPITKLMIQKYACGSGDFAQIHMDDEHARSVGLPGVIMHGMMSMAFLAQLMTDWLGDVEALKNLDVRFLGIVRPGDVLTCTGKVVERTEAEGRGRVVCDLSIVNQRGEMSTSGRAVAEL
jgi:acyl dehydratase